MKNLLVAILFCSIIISCSSVKKTPGKSLENENFEGWVTYKTIPVKPDMISQEDWDFQIKEIFGDQGYIFQKNYYKPGQFCAEMNSGLEMGMQVYNPMDSLHYAWQMKSDSALTENKNAPSFIKVVDMKDLDTMQVINGINCMGLQVDLNMGSYKIWYNKEVLKMNSEDYKGTQFAMEVIKRIGCLPLKSESDMITIEIIDFKKEKVPENIFTIPNFKHVDKKPQF